MAVLDSSAIIHLLNSTEKGLHISKHYATIAHSTTATTVNEVLAGARMNEREKIQDFLKGLEILPFDAQAAFKSADIEEKLQRTGKMINKLDILIAAIASLHDLPLLTTDADFKKIDTLKTIHI